MTDKVTPRPWRFSKAHMMVESIGKNAGKEDIICDVDGSQFDALVTEANARHIVKCVNNNERLVEVLRLAMDFIDKHPADPDITSEQADAWMRLQLAGPRELLTELDKGE